MTMPSSFGESIAASLRAASAADADGIEDNDDLEGQDNLETGSETHDGTEGASEEGENQDDQDPDETGDQEPGDEDREYEVKVNGKTEKVSLKELTEGYMRQSDYTKKSQALKAEQAEETTRLQGENQELSQRAQVAENIDMRFRQDPEMLIGDMLLTYGNDDPQKVSAGLVNVIKTLAGNGALTPDLLAFFQLDETAVRSLRQDVETRRNHNNRAAALAEQERSMQPLAVQQETVNYETQVQSAFDEVATQLGVPAEDQAAWRKAAFKYMIEEDLTDTKDAKRAARLAYRQYQLDKKEAEAAKPKPAKKVKSPVATPSRGGAPVPSATTGISKSSILANLRIAAANDQ